MSFAPRGPDHRIEPIAGSAPTAGAGPGGFAPPWPLLARLGPVLVLGPERGGLPAAPVHRVAIDSFGVRESLHWDGNCVFRLPDSDFYGWECLAVACSAGVEPEPMQRIPRARREARVLQARDGAWQPVLRLSATGWEQVRAILLCEGAALSRDARLRTGARGAGPARPVPPRWPRPRVSD